MYKLGIKCLAVGRQVEERFLRGETWWDPRRAGARSWRICLAHVPLCRPQVAARTGETGVRRRTQAMSRSTSKRRSRFSSLWGLDTTSKKKQGRPSINQVGPRENDKASHRVLPWLPRCGMRVRVRGFIDTECYLKSTSWHKDVSCGRCF